ncbi:piggyBac transposable element-derived protein 2 [Toxotes jaculatrix]|uniref:piggyBac transposable element-derived protein 2 n=1 Tax=Toxotes jaculatrix TaxID=941984 RepID=UPI001B3AF3E2|nr:piggyBac transposable element-derived protein 2 [Toxotes jaculatrix]
MKSWWQGAFTFFNVALSEEEQVLPLGAKVVTTLCKTITQPLLSVVFFDNYFTSFNLIQKLHANLGVKCIGTVRPNRLGGATLMADKNLMKKGHGAFDYSSAEGVIAVKWYDNKCVHLLSNACGIMPLSTVKRSSLIPAYNHHMGGIDLSDMLVHLYKTPAKSRRWYVPLFGYILDLCISNSWLVYKRDCSLLNKKPMPLKRFRLAVAHSLMQVNRSAPKVGRPSSCSPPPQKKRHTARPSQPQPDVRYDNCGHWPLHCDKRGRCNLCPKGVSRWKCQKCNKNHLSSAVLVNFYRSVIESILTSCITVWYGNSSVADRKALQRVVKTAQRITGTPLPSIEEVQRKRCLRRARNILKDSSHPANGLFNLLPSRRRFRSLRTRTSRLRNSFFPTAVSLLNLAPL